jgi:hypothetical protein
MVKKAFCTLLVICASLLASAQQVAVYPECNYIGRGGYLTVGRYYSYQMKVANDQLSSIQVPDGMKITIYEHDNFQGRSKTYFGNTPCLEAEWRNVASSLVVEYENGQPQGGQNDYVVFYADCYQRGVSQTLRPGTYTGSQLGSLKYNISSFTISGNLRIRLYLNNEYASGNATTHAASVYCLPQSQNDKTGSLVIEYIPGVQSGGNTGNSDEFATFYTECDFRGNAMRLMPGTYSGTKLGLMKNSIASIQVPSALRVKAYSSENMFGSSSLLTDDVNCLDQNLRNRIASLVVEYRSGAGNNQQQGGNEQVIIYADDNYQGQSATLLPGNYGTMAAAGSFPNDAVSSVYVPQGYRVVLYELENFGGKKYTLTASRSSFFLTNWNDKTSSIAVYKD